MRKLFFIFMVLFSVSAFSQNSMVLLKSGAYYNKAANDTVWADQYVNVVAYDSCKLLLVASDSVKAASAYINNAAGVAIGSVTVIDTLSGTTNNGTTAPYGNIVKGVKFVPSGPTIKARLIFTTTGNTYSPGTYKLYLLGYKR